MPDTNEPRPGAQDRRQIDVTDPSDDPRDPKKGTLRWALRQNEPRTVVLKVSKPIRLKDNLSITEDDLLLDGSKAPLCDIRDGTLSIKAGHVTLRDVRVRVGRGAWEQYKDGKRDKDTLPHDAISVSNAHDVVIEHCTAMWSWDEALSVDKSKRVRVERCLIAEPLDDPKLADGSRHAYGSRAVAKDTVFTRNVFAFLLRRAPRVASPEEGSPLDITSVAAVNNLVVCYADFATPIALSGDRVETLVKANVYMGPTGTSVLPAITLESDERGAKAENRVRLEGNFISLARGGYEEFGVSDDEPWVTQKGPLRLKAVARGIATLGGDVPSWMNGIPTIAPEKLEDLLLGSTRDGAGATPESRDAIDNAIVAKIRNVWALPNPKAGIVSKPSE